MKSLVVLLLPALAIAQCDNQMPSGKACGADDFFFEADPEACSWHYDCNEGCVKHLQCQPAADGLPKVWHETYEYCEYRSSVDCGDRPCGDAAMCVTQPQKTTTTTQPDCGHPDNCKEWGNGYFPDPYNCRKYWNCYGSTAKHFICPDDPATGDPEMFDEVYGGCNFEPLTECGRRPKCDECDENCETTDTPILDCGHKLDCTDKEDGWYSDEYNCRKYWHCLNKKGQHLVCPDDQQWKAEVEWCDYPVNVQCGDRPLCDECDQNCVTEPPGADCGPDDHHPADICKGRPPGYYPDMFNCIKYWVCNGELGTHMLCPEGQAWDAVKGDRCDWLGSVECGERPVCDVCDENCQ